jgi:hypothetical protein
MINESEDMMPPSMKKNQQLFPKFLVIREIDD